jgi:hypothetical protein
MEGEGSMLEPEFEFYKAHQDELTKKHLGKFIVIKGESVIGVYDSEMDAYLETEKSHKVGTFLIQHCLPLENLKQIFHSRVSFASGPCNPL